ncbi:MAG: recombination regulator RecX [Melioribacteraceae bacterium]|nr:recombination regulator RecX [Melioribacteraceae bacterium]
MIISRLLKKGNNVIIFFEDNSKIKIDYELVVKSGLRINDNLHDEAREKLLAQNIRIRVKNGAFNYLGRRHHSYFELRKKLSAKGYDKVVIDETLNELQEKGYIDDEDFAKRYIEESVVRKKSGTNKIIAGLYQKGISREIINRVMSSIDNHDEMAENALEITKKKLNSLKQRNTDKQKLKTKLFSFLSGKGYSSEIIKEVISQLDLNQEEEY